MVLQEVLQTQLELVDSQLHEMKQVVDERRDDAVDRALMSQDYADAKEEYDAAKDMLKTLKINHASKRIARS